MKTITRLCFASTLLLLSVVALTGQSTKTIAQIRGQGTEPFFDRGNQQIEREIQRLQRQQEEQDQKEQALDLEEQQNLDNQKPENSQQEETAPSPNLDSNIPESQQQK